MLALITTILPMAVNHWKLALAAFAALVFAGFVYAWHERGVAIDDLNLKNASLLADLKTASEEASLARDAQEFLAKRLADRGEQASKIQTLTESAANAPASKDGSIAPVLRDALDGVAKLRSGDH